MKPTRTRNKGICLHIGDKSEGERDVHKLHHRALLPDTPGEHRVTVALRTTTASLWQGAYYRTQGRVSPTQSDAINFPGPMARKTLKFQNSWW